MIEEQTIEEDVDAAPADRVGWANRLPLPGNPLVSMVIAAYKRPRELLSTIHCLLCQTHQNFEILVVHDGPGGGRIAAAIERLGDPRVRYIELPNNCNDWGNSSKMYGSQLASGDFIGHSNDDNYYAPVYFEWMLSDLIYKEAEFAYCNMVHSHSQWSVLDCRIQPGYIDGGGWICSASIVKSTPWESTKDTYSDGIYAVTLASKANKAVKVPGLIFVHN